MSLIGRPRKGFNVSAYNQQKLDREKKIPEPQRRGCITQSPFCTNCRCFDDEAPTIPSPEGK